jgi:small-conductance mechanosensitive channel
VVVTNISLQEEPDPKNIVKRYAHRWETQENPFKRMKPSLYLDTNHGLKVKQLPTNRTLARKRQELEDIIVAKETKIQKAEDVLKQAQQKLKQEQKSYQTISQETDKELKDVTSKLSQAPSRTIRLLQRQSKLLDQKEKAKEHWLKKQADLNSTVQEKTARIRSHQKTLKKAQEKLSKLPAEEKLYEIDTSKDQFMANLEVALTNADLYFKEHFLPAPHKRYDFKTIRDILYAQSGAIRQTPQEITVTLKPYPQEPEHQRVAEYAARKFNQANIYTPTNQKITIEVDRVG